MSRTLVLVTESYPYGGITESVFAAPDVRALAAEWDCVIIAPLLRRGKIEDSLPANVEVCDRIVNNPFWKHKWLRIFKALSPRVLSALSNRKPLASMKYALAALTVRDCLAALVGDKGLKRGNTLLMSYWFSYETTAMMWLGLPYISRAHGYDLSLKKAGKLRTKTLANSLGIWAASKAGAARLQETIADPSHKIRVAPLGSQNADKSKSAHHKASDRSVTFLSCARVVDIKRVSLNLDFMEALAGARPDWKFEWIHIGDGDRMPELKMRAAESRRRNLSIELKGAIGNSEVHELYRTRTIDWFLLLSTYEGGLPISICEALSYGVPAVATDTGGIPEAVDDSCGILMPADANPDEFVLSIIPYLDSDYRYGELSTGAFSRWAEHLDSDTLRPAFARATSSLPLLQNL